MWRRLAVAGGIALLVSAVPASLGAQLCNMCHTEFDEIEQAYYHYFLGVGEGTDYECMGGEGCHWEDREFSCIWVHYPCWDNDQLAASMALGLLDGDVAAVMDIAHHSTTAKHTEEATTFEFHGCRGGKSIVVVPFRLEEPLPGNAEGIS